MPKLWEALTPTSKRLAAELAREALTRLGTEAPTYSLPEGNPKLFQEVGPPIVAAIHLAMWEDATPQPGLPPPYERVLAPARNHALAGYLRRLFRGLDTPTPSQMDHMVRQIGAQLAGNHAAKRLVSKDRKDMRGLAPWAVAPPKSITVRHGLTERPAIKDTLTLKDEQILERRIEETRRPVATTFDLSAIPPPEPNPESVMEYVRKLRTAYTTLLERHHKVAVERDELAEKLEKYLEDEKRKAEGEDWAKVVREITANKTEGT